jgi:uncharacterized membrane protein
MAAPVEAPRSGSIELKQLPAQASPGDVAAYRQKHKDATPEDILTFASYSSNRQLLHVENVIRLAYDRLRDHNDPAVRQQVDEFVATTLENINRQARKASAKLLREGVWRNSAVTTDLVDARKHEILLRAEHFIEKTKAAQSPPVRLNGETLQNVLPVPHPCQQYEEHKESLDPGNPTLPALDRQSYWAFATRMPPDYPSPLCVLNDKGEPVLDAKGDYIPIVE